METIRAQKTEIQDHPQRIAALNACIDKISPELLWRTEELQEVEGFLLREESILLNFHSASIYFVFNIFFGKSQHRMGGTGKTQHRVRVSKSGRSS